MKNCPMLCVLLLFSIPVDLLAQFNSPGLERRSTFELHGMSAGLGASGQAEPLSVPHRAIQPSESLWVSFLFRSRRAPLNQCFAAYGCETVRESCFITTHHWSQEDFSIAVNAGFANVGAMADSYPFHKAFRLSAGYLFYNGDRVRADLHAKQDSVFTINDVDWISDSADPVHGIGRLHAWWERGTAYGWFRQDGFALRRGTSLSRLRLARPLSIHPRVVTMNLEGSICAAQGINCRPAASFSRFR